LAASEGSYHKKEQEGVLKEYRETLIREGKLDPKAALSANQQNLKLLGGAVRFSEKELCDVLPSIMQQEVRISAPETVEVARARSMMPPISSAKTHSVGFWSGDASLGKQAQQIASGRVRWAVPEEYGGPTIFLPEEDAAIRARNALGEKAARASARAILYGTAVSVVGTMVAFRFAISYYNINSIDDVSKAVGAAAAPVAASMRSTFSPMTTRLQERYHLEDLPEDSSIGMLSARLKKTFEKYKGNASDR